MKCPVWIFSALFVLILLFIPVSFAATHFINPYGNGEFPDIQSAVDNSAEGDTILLTDGNYSGERNSNIIINKQLIIKSASGRSENVIIEILHPNKDRNNRAFLIDSCSGILVISNLTIMNGRILNNSEYPYGGAIILQNSSPVLEKITFLNNYSSASGGAIACMNNSRPEIKNCSFIGNTTSATEGSAIFSENTEITVNNCLFINNYSKVKQAYSLKSILSGKVSMIQSTVLPTLNEPCDNTNNKELNISRLMDESDGPSIQEYFSDLTLIDSNKNGYQLYVSSTLVHDNLQVNNNSEIESDTRESDKQQVGEERYTDTSSHKVSSCSHRKRSVIEIFFTKVLNLR